MLDDKDVPKSANVASELMLLHRVYRGNKTLSSRNSYFLDNLYLTNFFEFAVGGWYSKYRTMEFPEIIKYKANTFLKIRGDNSFAHIVNPQTHRVGCSYAIFIDGLSLICYYFPYARFNRTVYLRAKPKNYQCPYNFPILDPIFKGLCKYADYKVHSV
ncbi:hypothetical protein KR222_005536 [Zaprionus bogoriensis]|nr:hypothetical protein KR222_005536 [Zaprionus bogoriensis]